MNERMSGYQSELERKAAEMLTRDGYRVQPLPDPKSLPFDLGGYRPDLLAVRDDEKLIVEVKGSMLRATIDRYKQIAEVVSSCPGWRFVLVTPDDVTGVGHIRMLTWGDIEKRHDEAVVLMQAGQIAAGLLLLWSAFEAAMRRQAQETNNPAERLPLSALMKHLYSNGELSMEQYDRAVKDLQIRNYVAHGYEVKSPEEVCKDLSALLTEVLSCWPNEVG